MIDGILAREATETRLRRAYGFEEVALVPGAVTADPAEVDLATEIGARVVYIREDHVIAGMARGLGAEVRCVERPFNPEGGAYGQGAVQGHSHHRHHHHHHHHHHDH